MNTPGSSNKSFTTGNIILIFDIFEVNEHIEHSALDR